MSDFPYAGQFEVHRTLPEEGTDQDAILEVLSTMSEAENQVWESGQCSGTMYCGDHDHYDFLNKAFSNFSYVNSLQRDMCPSSTKFEAEIIAMTLDMLGASALTTSIPGGLITSGGSGSIAHAMLAYRESNSDAKSRPNVIKPETAHPAFDKACHLFGIELRVAPVDPVSTQVDLDWVKANIDASTVALVGSAGNYGYGTIDPIGELGRIALEHGVGLHVDGCLGGFILPFGRELGYDIEPFDFSVPGVTTISADTHKYGYALKGTSVLCFADQSLRNSQYFYRTDWSGGKYCSPGMDGSRSGGLLAATWAAMVHLGRSGYRRYADAIFATSAKMQEAVRSHESLRIMGKPTFLFSFTSDDYDIYHVNDFLRTKGWRLNGQQYPNAIHMAVTRPQTQPGTVERFSDDLAEAVAYAKAHAHETPKSGAIYGGVAGGPSDEADAFIKMFMAAMMDQQTSIPAL
jgi:glutamate/tyrosine decarboxylase-like PLP-dependent enzyme